MMYPVMLDLTRQRCLVVGGGAVALRKVEGLLAAGALVVIVAADPSDAVVALAAAGQATLERRPYQRGEVARYRLVFAATNDPLTNAQVAHDAAAAGVWVNAVDDPERCTFQAPARVERGALQLAIGSNGLAPFAVRRLRQLFDRRLGPEWGPWLDAAASLRKTARALGYSPAERERCFDAFFAGTLDAETLKVRVPMASEEASWLRKARPQPAGITPFIGARAAGIPDMGLVSLVGAGPGDPGLLTMAGHERLLAADAIVYDRLAALALPTGVTARVELHCVGKAAGHHSIPQEEIDALLVRLSREGKRVVRFKGGDPFVFGRGAEEAEALCAAGVPFEVIPAATAAVAVAAYAGIPLTKRREASYVTMFSAHAAAGSEPDPHHWELLAASPHGTLVGYMGVTGLARVAERLLAGGMAPDTSAAMIERGTTSAQRVILSTLAELPAAARAAAVAPPALLVIGPTVRHAARLGWYSQRPLFGHRLALFRPESHFRRPLANLGAEVVPIPLPVTPAARIVMEALPPTAFIFGAVLELDALEHEPDRPAWAARAVALCLTPLAAARARVCGWQQVVDIPGAASLAQPIKTLAEILRSRGRRSA